MNRKAIIGTIVWGLILFILISAFVFYVTFKDQSSNSVNKTNEKIEEISIQEVSNKLTLDLLTARQSLK